MAELVPNRHTWPSLAGCASRPGYSQQPLPKRKFNGAQRLAYTGVIAMGAGSLITGLAIYKPVQLAWLTAYLGGYPMARLEHFGLTVVYVLFFFIHIPPGHPCRVEQLPSDGSRCRSREPTGGRSCDRR